MSKLKAAEEALEAAAKLLKKIATPEDAVKLSGKAKEEYLNALHLVYGPIEKRATDMGFSPETLYHGSNASDIKQFGQGGSVDGLPEGFQLDAEEPSAVPAMATSDVPEGFQLDEEKYGSLKQQAIAGVEGLASGILGPIAPAIETNILGVKPEDIRGREEENPITSGIGEAAGLIGSTIAGVGVGGVMTKAGKLAQEAAGLAKAMSFGAKVGSTAVQQAAEMAVMQGSDEVSKKILHTPEDASESALANIGLAAALGGGAGAVFTGAMSPLWKATAGPALEKTLNMVKNRVNGGGNLLLPEARETALKTLGIEADPLVRAAVSDDLTARQYIAALKRGENKTVFESLNKLEADASASVAQSMNMSPEDVLRYDVNTVGHDVRDMFTKELKEKYDPLSARYAKKDAEAALLTVSDDARLAQRDRLIEKGMEAVGTDSPYYKLYDDYGDRILAKDTIGGLDKLTTEINSKISVAKRSGDFAELNALQDIKYSLNEFKEKQITDSANEVISELGGVSGKGSGVRSGKAELKAETEAMLAERANITKDYAKFAQTIDELTNHLGIGDFRGTGTLISKLTDKISPEELLKKFSMRNNADFIPFLQKHFPATFEKVIANERQQLIKPAVIAAAKKGENPIDINRLSDIINKQMSERSSYIDTLVSKDTINKIEAAKTLIDAIPKPRDSGTPAGMRSLFGALPTSALAAVGWMTGHNPILSGLVGHTASKAGQALPEAYKLAYLKFLGETQPVKSEGFKAMVDFFHATYKAENDILKSIRNVFKGSSQVLASNMIVDQKDRDRLDRLVDKGLKDPDAIIRSQASSDVGYYLPQHQAALSNITTKALQYLQGIKPHPFKPGPLDPEIPPSKAEIARYNRALDIANSPMTVLQHIKDGTLQITDVQDLDGMYPGLHKGIISKLSNEMVKAVAKGELIPYKTRVSMSLFMGQPMDMSLTPSSIMAAQPMPKARPQQPQEPQSKGRPSALKGKSAKMFQTATQQAELDRASRQ